MPTLSHPRASWPEHAPRPRRTARDYTDVVVLSVMVCVLFAYASLEKALHASRPPVVPSERPSHARRLSFAVTSSVGWNTPASEGEIVTTKGLKGFETSYAVYFGDGAGGFTRSLPFGSDDDQSYAVRLADVDLDGDLDIVVANVRAQNAVYFNRNGGAPAFDELRFGCADCATYGLAVGDLNGDGFPEIVTANSGAPNGVFANVAGGR